MYEVIKKVIESKKYELSDILKKIDTLWLQGDISDSQKEQLVSMARNNADLSQSIKIIEMFDDLEERIRVLEEKVLLSNTTTEESEVLKYKPNKKYKNGDKVSFEGKTYICIVPDEEKCVWSPKDYPDYWELVTNEDS